MSNMRASDSPLAALLKHMAQHAPDKYKLLPDSPKEHADEAVFSASAEAELTKTPTRFIHGWPAEPLHTDYFQKTWSRLGTSKQLIEAQRQVPENAGPLNTNQLIHRAMQLMQEQSPQYLQHFIRYIDTLSWLEATTSAQTQASKPPQRASSTKKPSPRKS